jgi:hypothetical protein
MRRISPLVISGIILSSYLAGCAASPAAKHAKTERHLRGAAAALATKADADSLAAAGVLNVLINREDSLALLDRATAAAPERADLVWLHFQLCQKIASCDQEPMERRLRELDSSNGAGWLGALARASSSKNDEAKDAALAAIGHSDRVDIYWTTLIAGLTRATARTKTISVQQAEVAIIGILAAQAIPAYSAASNACKGERLQRAEIIEVCRGVASAFQHGDTYITEMLGVAIAKRVWPEDSAEWKAADKARRLYEYRSTLWPTADAWNMDHTQEYLTLCADNRREQDVFLAQLIAAGKDPNPPAK